MAANYSCLLLDLDGTLLDFAAAEQEAIAGTLGQFGLPNDEETIGQFSAINAALWQKLEKGEIKKEKLVTLRFTQLLQALGKPGDAARINSEYVARLANEAPIYPGADELLEELAEFATLAAITNGVQKTQFSRLEKSGLLPYFDGVFVSEKLGVTKPSSKFFDIALRQLGVQSKSRVLVVGDSLTADIKGGQAAQLHTCWMNFAGSENTTGIQPTYMARSYAQLKLIAVGEEELRLAATREKRHLV